VGINQEHINSFISNEKIQEVEERRKERAKIPIHEIYSGLQKNTINGSKKNGKNTTSK